MSGRDRVEQNRRRSALCLSFFTGCPTVSVEPFRYYSSLLDDNSLLDSCYATRIYMEQHSRNRIFIRNGSRIFIFDNSSRIFWQENFLQREKKDRSPLLFSRSVFTANETSRLDGKTQWRNPTRSRWNGAKRGQS